MGAVWNNLAESGAGRNGFVAFTLDFTTMASNAFLSILEQVVVAHNPSPHQTGYRNRNNRTKGIALADLQDYVKAL